MPWAIAGKNNGVAQVLSSKVVTPRALAAATIVGTSCTSKVRLPGLSSRIARVFSAIKSAIPPPISGS
ncbi:hypothetical protein D9M73_274000 [compost metagenome]